MVFTEFPEKLTEEIFILFKRMKVWKSFCQVFFLEITYNLPSYCLLLLKDRVKLIRDILFDAMDDISIEFVNFSHLFKSSQNYIFHAKYFMLFFFIGRKIIHGFKNFGNNCSIPFYSLWSIRNFIVSGSYMVDDFMYLYDVFN